jgi:hypothetical protein
MPLEVLVEVDVLVEVLVDVDVLVDVEVLVDEDEELEEPPVLVAVLCEGDEEQAKITTGAPKTAR